MNQLLLGNQAFATNLIQGPLAGVSCAPFRRLAWQHSQPAFSCTEMISSHTIVHGSPSQHRRYLKKDLQEGPVCFQLSGTDPHLLAEAVKRVTDQGADCIDLNCGCPVRKIREKGAGSRLLMNPILLGTLITAMKQNTHLPVSVKIRVEGECEEKSNAEVARAVTDAGADFLVVHGRHWTENYDVACRYDQIAFFVSSMKIPVIGNGDVSCIASLKKMSETGCAGMMIGRSGVGQPWLIAKLRAEMRGEVFVIPAWEARANMLITHVEELASLLENERVALLQARQFAKYYARGLVSFSAFCDHVNLCQDIETLKEMINRHFIYQAEWRWGAVS
ncbi:MAG TPA: tRNA-dihydrouridine synthase [Gammaproteobacteria bacterium]|jgi:tRNA-dihydrouridine synthase B|nr:tRNA-dihydrouridine synthase [Gammaproteobacteria bacterium]